MADRSRACPAIVIAENHSSLHLQVFGQEGDFHMGLKRLWGDSPVFWTGDTERNPGDHGRIADQIDRTLFDCWKRAL